MRFIYLSFFLSLILPVACYSQNTLKGVVRAADNNEILAGASVLLKGTSYGVKTDAQGRFELQQVPNGMYLLQIKYVSFQTYEDSLLLSGGKEVEKIISLEKSNRELKNVHVKAAKKTNTEKSVMQEIRNAGTVVSGISGAQISKSADRNAAEVVKRIPGVTIQEDRFILIRGLSERYNEVWLNNATAPGAETDQRAFSFDMIPSGVIDRILVFKTPAADLPGNFAGGAVKIFTNATTETNLCTFSYSTSYRNGTTFQPYYYTSRSSTDWLGYDNNYRVLPAGIPAYVSKNDAAISDITHRFVNNWRSLQETAIPDQRIQFNLQHHWKGKRGPAISSISTASYSMTHTTNVVERNDYDSTAINFQSRDRQYQRQVQINLMENIGLKWKSHHVEWKNLLNQSGREFSTYRTNTLSSENPYQYYAFGYMCRRNLLSQLSGTHTLTPHGMHYEWTLSYNDAFRNEPDLRRINYSLFYNGVDSVYKAQVANVVDPVSGGGRFYQSLREHSFSLHHLLKKDMLWKTHLLELQAGQFLESRQRVFAARVLGYTIKPGATAYQLTQYSLDSLFNPDHTGQSTNFRMDEITSLPDSYTAGNFLVASYVMANLVWSPKWKVQAGVRYEYNLQTLNSFTNLDSSSEVHEKLRTAFFLPSGNISYQLDDKSLLRLAAGKTLNRPEFREMAPYYFYDYDLRIGNYGSLYPTTYFPQGIALKVARIWNADLRFEWYGSGSDMLHAGVFYKYFNSPIQKVITSDYKGLTYINTKDAVVYGMEAEWRRNLKHLSPALRAITLVSNLTLQQSRMQLPDLPNQLDHSRLQGQSPYVINAGWYMQNDSATLQASLLYNVFGPRVFAIGSAFYASTAELPFHSLDALGSWRFTKRCTAQFGVQNLLNEQVRMVLDINRDGHFNTSDALVKRYRPGTCVTAGIRVQLSH